MVWLIPFYPLILYPSTVHIYSIYLTWFVQVRLSLLLFYWDECPGVYQPYPRQTFDQDIRICVSMSLLPVALGMNSWTLNGRNWYSTKHHTHLDITDELPVPVGLDTETEQNRSASRCMAYLITSNPSEALKNQFANLSWSSTSIPTDCGRVVTLYSSWDDVQQFMRETQTDTL